MNKKVVENIKIASKDAYVQKQVETSGEENGDDTKEEAEDTEE